MRLGRLAAMATLGVAGWAAGAGLAATTAFAAPCGNGSQCPPSALTISPSATLLASISGTINAASSFSASYVEEVYRDPSNEFCANCLTWILKVSNSAGSTDPIQHVNISNFAGYAADFGVNSSNAAPSGTTGGAHVPSSVNRSGSGGVLTWNFQGAITPTAGELPPGQTAVLLEAETNATQFAPGLVSAQDGGAAQADGFQPAGAPGTNIPEAPWVPALGLMGGVAAGGFALRRRGGSTPAQVTSGS